MNLRIVVILLGILTCVLIGCQTSVQHKPIVPQLTKPEVQATVQRLENAREASCVPGNYNGGGRTFSSIPVGNMDAIIYHFAEETTVTQLGCWTGIMIAGSATVYAVEAGTVIWVGPIYCSQSNACRGDSAMIIDHGDNVYTIYSHVKDPQVGVNEVVTTGQPIAQQGDLGFGDIDQVLFEVHTGYPYSGDWSDPWKGFGEFDDPCMWLPEGVCETP